MSRFSTLVSRLYFSRLMLPQIKPRGESVAERGFQSKDKRLIIDLDEGKRDRERGKKPNRDHRHIERQEAVEDIDHARAAHEVHELLDGERPENLILYVDELGNLESHIHGTDTEQEHGTEAELFTVYAPNNFHPALCAEIDEETKSEINRLQIIPKLCNVVFAHKWLASQF